MPGIYDEYQQDRKRQAKPVSVYDEYEADRAQASGSGGGDQRQPGAPLSDSGDSFDEGQFQKAYADIVARRNAMGMPLDPNPDNPAHKYDYRAAFRRGEMEIDPVTGHFWSGSRDRKTAYKADDHPTRFIDGEDTATGVRLAPPPVFPKSRIGPDGSLPKDLFDPAKSFDPNPPPNGPIAGVDESTLFDRGASKAEQFRRRAALMESPVGELSRMDRDPSGFRRQLRYDALPDDVKTAPYPTTEEEVIGTGRSIGPAERTMVDMYTTPARVFAGVPLAAARLGAKVFTDEPMPTLDRLANIGNEAAEFSQNHPPQTAFEAGARQAAGAVGDFVSYATPMSLPAKAAGGFNRVAAPLIKRFVPQELAGAARLGAALPAFTAAEELPAIATGRKSVGQVAGEAAKSPVGFARSLAEAPVEIGNAVSDMSDRGLTPENVTQAGHPLRTLAVVGGLHAQGKAHERNAKMRAAAKASPAEQTAVSEVKNVSGRTPEAEPVQDVAGEAVPSATGDNAIATGGGTAGVRQAPVESPAPPSRVSVKKQPWDMTIEELERASVEHEAAVRNIVEPLIGEAKYKSFKRGNNGDLISDVEDMLASRPKDYDTVFRTENPADYVRPVSQVGGLDAVDLANEIYAHVEKLPDPKVSQDAWSYSEKIAVAAMNEARRWIDREGFNPQEVGREVAKKIARRYSDPVDAEFMLENAMRRLGGNAAPQPQSVPKQIAVSERAPVEAGAETVTPKPQGEINEQQGTAEKAGERGEPQFPQQHAKGQKPGAADAQEAALRQGTVTGTGEQAIRGTGEGTKNPSPVRLVGKTPQEKLRNRARRIAESGIGEPEVSALPTNRPRLLNEAGTGKVQVTAPEIIKTLERVGGAPIRAKLYNTRIGGAKALGIFKHPPHTIRLGEVNDLQTAAHEAGHALHNLAAKMSVKIPTPAAKELYQLGYELYGTKPNGDPYPRATYLKEGIAEYVAQRFMSESPDARFPEAHKWVEQNLLRDPKRLAAMEEAQGQFRQWNDQGAESRFAASFVDLDPTPIKQRAKNAVDRLRDNFTKTWRRMVTDELAPLEDAVNQAIADAGLKPDSVLPSGNPFKVATALKMNAPGTARHMVYEATVDHAGRKTGDSLSHVLQPVKARLREFTLYAAARRVQLLESRGIKNLPTLTDANAVVKKYDSPEFQTALDGVTQWSRRLLDYVQEAGGLSPEVREAIELLNPIYVPFQKVLEASARAGGRGTGKGIGNLPSAVKRIGGSGDLIRNPMVEFVHQAERMVTLGNKMRVAKSLAEFGQKIAGAGWIAEKIDLPKEVTTFSLAEIESQLKQAKIDLEGANLDQILAVFDNAQSYRGHQNVVSIWRNGKREFWEIDKGVYKSIMDMDKDSVTAWLSVIPGLSLIPKAKRGVQLGATGLSLPFMLRNAVRDAMMASITTAAGPESFLEGRTMPRRSLEGLWESLQNGTWAKRFNAGGGEMATLMGQDRIEAAKALKMSLAKGTREKTGQIIRHPVDALRTIPGHIERAPRLAEFRRVFQEAMKKPGYTELDAQLEAMLAAKDLTVNFTRTGIVSRVFNAFVPFFNAKVQGASKFYRTFSGVLSGDKDARSRALRATGRAFEYITLPTIALWAINRDQDWYRRRKRWEKAAYWMFSWDDGETIIKLPKPFDIGHVFGTVPEALLDMAYRRDENSRRDLNAAVWETIKSFTPVSGLMDMYAAALKPVTEAAFNYDTFKERPIESDEERRGKNAKLAKDRYDEWTTHTARALSKAIFHVTPEAISEELGPRKIEHLISGYTGGLGLDALRWADWFTGKQTLTREKVAPDVPVVGTFFARPDSQVRPQQVDDFYEQLQTLRQKSNSKAITPEEKRRLDASERILDKGQIKSLRKKIKRATGIARTQLQRQLDRVIDGEVKKRRVLEPK